MAVLAKQSITIYQSIAASLVDRGRFFLKIAHLNHN
jgi:hypothetical protein